MGLVLHVNAPQSHKTAGRLHSINNGNNYGATKAAQCASCQMGRLT